MMPHASVSKRVLIVSLKLGELRGSHVESDRIAFQLNPAPSRVQEHHAETSPFGPCRASADTAMMSSACYPLSASPWFEPLPPGRPCTFFRLTVFCFSPVSLSK